MFLCDYDVFFDFDCVVRVFDFVSAFVAAFSRSRNIRVVIFVCEMF